MVSHCLTRSAGNYQFASICCMDCVCDFTGTYTCFMCVSKQNEFKSLRVCVSVCVGLTFMLWLVIAGNPSTSQSKKTIKQRFLKLLPCCKPSAAPSISQSKCTFTLYTSLRSSMCPASCVDAVVHSHTSAETFSVHINPLTETHTALKETLLLLWIMGLTCFCI